MNCCPKEQSFGTTVGATMSSRDDLCATPLLACLVKLRNAAKISVVRHASVVAVTKSRAATVHGRANANEMAVVKRKRRVGILIYPVEQIASAANRAGGRCDYDLKWGCMN